MGPSDKERRDLRGEILIAARQQFIQQGYHAPSMRQIAATVGVSKPALYYYFKDKEELFLAVVLERLEEISGLIDHLDAEGGTTRQKVAWFVHRILALPPEQRAVIRLASQEMGQLSPAVQGEIHRAYREKFLGKLRAIFEAGLLHGELRKVDPELAVWTLLGMMYPYFYPVHSADAPPPEEIAGQILEIYLDGLALPGYNPENRTPPSQSS